MKTSLKKYDIKKDVENVLKSEWKKEVKGKSGRRWKKKFELIAKE